MSLRAGYSIKFASVASYLIKRAIPQALVAAVRTRIVNNLKKIKELSGKPGSYKDIKPIYQDQARALALLNRVSAAKAGLRLSRGGQELMPGGGVKQLFMHRGYGGAAPSGFATTFKTRHELGAPSYSLEYLQGYGSTKGRPTLTYRNMRREVADLHGRAGIPLLRADLTPGRRMPHPGSFDTKIVGGKLIATPNPEKQKILGEVDALKTWANPRHEFTHMKFKNPQFRAGGDLPLYAYFEIAPKLREVMMKGLGRQAFPGRLSTAGGPTVDPALISQIMSPGRL
jgi:hypothetical protein